MLKGGKYLDYKNEIKEQIKNISNIEDLKVDAGQREVYKAQHSQYGTVVIKVVKQHDSEERVKREIDINTSNKLLKLSLSKSELYNLSPAALNFSK